MFSSRARSSSRSLASAALGVQVALSAVAVLAQDQGQREPPTATGPVKENLSDASAAQMFEGLENMRAAASGNAEQLRKSAEQFALATEHYASDIEKEGPLSGQRALEIRSVIERTLLEPGIVEGALQLPEAQALCKSIATLYGVVLPKLIAMRQKSFAEAAIADKELEAHYQRLLRVTCTASSAGKPFITQLLIDHYAHQSIVPMYRVFSAISEILTTEPGLTSQIAVRNFEAISESFSQRFSQFLREGGPEQAKHFLTLHQHLSRGITYARDQGAISAPQYERLDREISTKCIEPLVPQLFTLWLADDWQRKSSFSRHCWSLLNSSPLSNEAARTRADSSTESVIDLLAAWRGDRHTLGTLYFDCLDRYRAQYGACREVGYASIGVLPLVAPEPQRKGYIVEALRASLVDDGEHELLGETATRPSQVGRVLALCLLSDHLFFATKANTSYDPAAASSLMAWLKGNHVALGSYEGTLTPSQGMFVELLRLARGGESAESVHWITQYDARSREQICDRAQQALTWLMYEVYRCKPLLDPADSSGATTTAVLSIPWEWGAAVARLPGEGRVAEWRESEREFLTLADLVFEEAVHKQPTGSSEFNVSVRINEALDIVRVRGGYQDRRDPDRQCAAVQVIKELYRDPADGSSLPSNSYFTTLQQTVVDLQRAALSSSGEVPLENEIKQRAHTYVETLQRLCIVEFLQQELSLSGVVESAHGGSISRELREVCKQFGFLERDPRISGILAEKTVSLISAQAQDYAQQLAAELSSLVRDMQIVKP
jgi:hypothetical protein